MAEQGGSQGAKKPDGAVPQGTFTSALAAMFRGNSWKAGHSGWHSLQPLSPTASASQPEVHKNRHPGLCTSPSDLGVWDFFGSNGPTKKTEGQHAGGNPGPSTATSTASTASKSGSWW